MLRRTLIALVTIAILAGAGWLGWQWIQRAGVGEEPVVDFWIPLTHLEATGDLAVIAGAFGGMADDDSFRINTTRHVVTSEGTYAEMNTRIAVVGPDTVVQSAANGSQLDFADLVRLPPGSQVSILVQGSMQGEPTVHAYVVIIP